MGSPSGHHFVSIDGSDQDDSFRCEFCGGQPGYRPFQDGPCPGRPVR